MKDLNEIFDKDEVEKFKQMRRKSERESYDFKTALDKTNLIQDTFLTTCEVWKDNNLANFIDRNSEEGK